MAEVQINADLNLNGGKVVGAGGIVVGASTLTAGKDFEVIGDALFTGTAELSAVGMPNATSIANRQNGDARWALTGHTQIASTITDLTDAINTRIDAWLLSGQNMLFDYAGSGDTFTLEISAAFETGVVGDSAHGARAGGTLHAAFTSGAAGFAPASGGGTTNFLRADGTWAAPAGGGGVTDGDKGDITVSSGGTAWAIDAGAVTLTKMANLATSTILGRATAGTGVPEALTPAAVRTMLGIVAIATSGSAADLTAGILPAARFDDTSHGARAGGTLHAVATGSVAGFLSAADKTKLDGIATGATVNAADAALRDRETHTGTQASGTISDFAEAVDDRVAGLLVQGANVTLTYNDGAGTLTIAAAGGGGATDLAYNAVTRVVSSSTGADATLPLMSSGNAGLVPASGGGTTNFLRADGTFAAPAGGGGLVVNSVELDLGATPVKGKSVTVVDGSVTPSTKIVAYQAGRAATGRPADENEWTRLHVVANPGAGSITFWLRCLTGTMRGRFIIDYMKG